MKDRNLTVRDIVQQGCRHRRVVGRPEQIADAIDHWFTEGVADGFNIMNDVYPSGLQTFVDRVIPILQQRGLFRKEYGDKTLRRRYGLICSPSIHEQEEKCGSIA